MEQQIYPRLGAQRGQEVEKVPVNSTNSIRGPTHIQPAEPFVLDLALCEQCGAQEETEVHST